MRVLKLLIRMIIHIISFLFYFTSGLFPRNNKIIIFGCWNGKSFRGNSKYLYLYIRDNYPDVKSVWLTKNCNLNIKLRQEGVNSYFAFSIKGIIYSLKAKYFIVSHGIRDVNEYFSRKGILINLGHSTYPIKSIYLDPPSESLIYKICRYLAHPYGYLIRPDFAITSSQVTAIATQKHFNINTDRIILLGTPKSDILFLNKYDGKNICMDLEYQKYSNMNKKRILFLPTWRQNTSFSIFDFGFNPKELDDFLSRANAILGINFHPTSANKNTAVDLSACKNIKLFNSYGDDINYLLSRTDILITDYSSLFADFLMYDKPIVFAKFDHQSYLKEQGLFLDYDKDLPGSKVQNWQEMIEKMKDILINNKDEYKNKRFEMINKIYPIIDGKARERIANFIMSLP
jgi:CDP-glycerol glycerophosphotransferase (TagB/SpsB family)